MFGLRLWAISVLYAAGAALLLGILSVLIPNHLFSRTVPTSPQDYVIWALSALLCLDEYHAVHADARFPLRMSRACERGCFSTCPFPSPTRRKRTTLANNERRGSSAVRSNLGFITHKLKSTETLVLYFDAIPNCDIIFQTSCQEAWMRIVPGSILIFRAIYLNVIVTRYPFPKTERVCLTLPQILTLYVVRRKVVIALNNKIMIALSECDTIPTSFSHSHDSLLALVSL